MVSDILGPNIQSTLITQGLHSGPDTPAAFHVVASILFADKAALDAAMAVIGPVAGDIPNFYSGAPIMLFGETLGQTTLG